MKKFIFILFTLIINLSWSQNDYRAEFRHLEALDLEVNRSLDITFDSDNRFWAATDKGLLRFDGYNKHFLQADPQNENTPIENGIRRIFRTTIDEFWLVYDSSLVISRYTISNGIFKHFYPDTTQANKLPPILCTSIFRDSQKRLWISSWGDGLFLLDEESGNCKQQLFLEEGEEAYSCNIKDFAELSDGKLLVSFFLETRKEKSWPVIYDPETETFERLPIQDYIDKIDDPMSKRAVRIALSIVHFVHVEDDQHFWFGCYTGVIQLDLEKGEAHRIYQAEEDLKKQNIENTHDYVDSKKGLWIATTNRGLMYVDKSNRKVTYHRHDPHVSNSISDNRIASVSKDLYGNIWVSSKSGDISIYAPTLQVFQLHDWAQMQLDFTDRSRESIPVDQMLVKNGQEVLLSNKDQIVSYNKNTFEINQVVELNGGLIEASIAYRLAISGFRVIGDSILMSAGRAPVLTHKGKQLLNGPQRNRSFTPLFRHIVNDKDLPLIFIMDIIRTKEGQLLHYKTETNEVEVLYDFPLGTIPSRRFSYVLADGKWLISESGGRFIIYDPVQNNHQLFSPSQTSSYFPDSTVHVAYPDGEDLIWLGTKKGLYRFYPKDNSYEKCNTQAGLGENEAVRTIIRDQEGILWLASRNTLIRWDEENNTTFRFKRETGLNVGAFLESIAQMDEDGILYFATINGLLIFDPSEVKIPTEKIKLSLSSVSVNDELQDEQMVNEIQGSPYLFHWSENFLSFEFHTNKMFTPIPYRFEYRLIGQGEGWIDNGTSNKIRFADLNHGHYTLEVRVIDAYDIPGETFQLSFDIKTPYWFSGWFYAAMGTIFVLLIIVFIRYRERKLRRTSEILERKVEERTIEVVRQKQEADLQREIAIERQIEITDSINYAKRIQDAILPDESLIKNCLPDSFVLYLPKDIVAGDFYWFEQLDEDANQLLYAAADCTGHGVPGAMVSVVCNNALNRSAREFSIRQPGKLLDKTRELVIEQFEKGQEGDQKEEIKDGMDISLCLLDKKSKKILWAGANNPIWIIRNGELLETKADKQPIGKYESSTDFTTHEIDLEKGDVIYTFTDGYADQFGGEKGKKLKTTNLKKLFLRLSTLSMQEQKQELINFFNEWMGQNEQLDDVCVIGVRID
ncbi:MAG: SpoIIE family protein phosphatase [Flavobacteriales bacterium]|nr:SpoIIE family protein phosphatase [Flavobacteriales bacterium]